MINNAFNVLFSTAVPLGLVVSGVKFPCVLDIAIMEEVAPLLLASQPAGQCET